MRTRIFIIMFMTYALCSAATADSVQVSFVNFYPGQDIYELEGHSALRIRTPRTDIVVSYGTFDFNAPNFVYRFVRGETDYWAAAGYWQPFAQEYMRQGRRIVEHPLLLDSAQTARLVELVEWNLLPQNRVYRYNYVKDNCSLRPLRVVEQAVGDSIELPLTSLFAEGVSFRDVMRHYHRNYPWYQFGIDLALGSGIDYPIDARGQAFAPVVLDEQLPNARIYDPGTGESRPLTAAPNVIYKGSDATLGATPWYLTPMTVALLLLAISIGLTIRDIKGRKVTRWFDAALYALYGVLGLILTFLIFVSVHEATSPNWLYLWLNPLCLIVPIFIWLKKCNIVVLSYQFVNFALILAMCVAWPWTGQSGNPAFVPLILCDLLRSTNYIYVSISNKPTASALSPGSVSGVDSKRQRQRR